MGTASRIGQVRLKHYCRYCVLAGSLLTAVFLSAPRFAAAENEDKTSNEEEIRTLLDEGVDLWRSKHSEEAKEKFEQVICLNPQNAEAHFSMGIIYESTRNYVEAIASYKRALAIFPDRTDYQEAVAVTEKKLAAKRKLEAEQAPLKSLAAQAAAAYKRGDYSLALNLYHQLDDKSPKQAIIKYNLGTVYIATHNRNRALEYYKQACELKPNEQRYQTAYKNLLGGK